MYATATGSKPFCPPELWDYILDHVDDLRSASVVCRQWRPRAQHVHFARAARATPACLAGAPHVWHAVRRLTLDADGEMEGVRILLAEQPHLPRLKTLELLRWDVAGLEDEEVDALAVLLKGVERLALREVRVRGMQQLSRLVTRLPRLHSLRLEMMGFCADDDDEEVVDNCDDHPLATPEWPHACVLELADSDASAVLPWIVANADKFLLSSLTAAPQELSYALLRETLAHFGESVTTLELDVAAAAGTDSIAQSLAGASCAKEIVMRHALSDRARWDGCAIVASAAASFDAAGRGAAERVVLKLGECAAESAHSAAWAALDAVLGAPAWAGLLEVVVEMDSLCGDDIPELEVIVRARLPLLQSSEKLRVVVAESSD